jgi:hypothetical protein
LRKLAHHLDAGKTGASNYERKKPLSARRVFLPFRVVEAAFNMLSYRNCVFKRP